MKGNFTRVCVNKKKKMYKFSCARGVCGWMTWLMCFGIMAGEERKGGLNLVIGRGF